MHIPASDIRIDKEGNWYFRGAEMVRKDIVSLFYQNLQCDESGRYMIVLPDDWCYLDVEDAPFVVKSIVRRKAEQDREESIYILLNDETVEELDPETLRTGQENILYCSVRNRRFPARFSRPGYYQLAELIEYDPDQDAFFLAQNNRRYVIRTGT